MHVGLNLLYLVPGETGGTETVARQLVPALAAAAPASRFTAFVSRAAGDLDLGIERKIIDVDARARVQWVVAEQALLPRAAARAGCALVHSLASTAPVHGRFARVVTINDLLHRTLPDAHFGARAAGMRLVVSAAARRADHVITASEQTRRQVIATFGLSPGAVTTVPYGPGSPPLVVATKAPELRSRLALDNRRIALSLSAKRPHKNLARLLEALALMPAERRPMLVLAGYPTPHETELRELAALLGLERDVRWTGWLPPGDVEGLLALCDLLVFPSIAEGFGLPVLEAMRRGVPVACSDIPALRELAGDTARYFDPLRPASIACALDDPPPAAAARSRAALFSWDRAARETLAVYAHVLGEAKPAQ